MEKLYFVPKTRFQRENTISTDFLGRTQASSNAVSCSALSTRCQSLPPTIVLACISILQVSHQLKQHQHWSSHDDYVALYVMMILLQDRQSRLDLSAMGALVNFGVDNSWTARYNYNYNSWTARQKIIPALKNRHDQKRCFRQNQTYCINQTYYFLYS